MSPRVRTTAIAVFAPGASAALRAQDTLNTNGGGSKLLTGAGVDRNGDGKVTIEDT